MELTSVVIMVVAVCAVVSETNLEDDEESQLSRSHVIEATEYGLQRMNDLVNVEEPRLYQKGMLLEKDNPASYVAAFNRQTETAKRLAKFGYASLQASSMLAQRLSRKNGEGRRHYPEYRFPTISLLHTSLYEQCPLRNDQPPNCPSSSGRYRTADGRCNNPAHPWRGAAMMPLHRFLPSHYKDGLEKIRDSVSGGPLPSARAISTAVHSDRNSELTTITHMVMQWGQFLDHDLTSSAQTRGYNGSVPKCCTDGGRDFQPPKWTHPDCMPIPVPPDDWFYSRYGVRCLEFVRSSPTSRLGCLLGPRDQINQVTSFIDASAIYGSSEFEEDSLRMFKSGLLKYKRILYHLPLLPAASHKAELCRGQTGHIRCFNAGDKRVNEQPGLIAIHTIMMRAHNRIATELSHINPHWRDEKLYQETRRIIGAIMQHITYKEFLPIVLGPDVMRLFDLELLRKGYYRGYDIKANPMAANAFGTAAFRFGHSLVQHNLLRCDRRHKEIYSNVTLHEELTNPSNLYNIGSVDRLLLGMCTQPAQRRDEFITGQLTNHLFQTPHYRFGMDLAALNIQRGRDHGLPPYNAWREPCGLKRFSDWPELLRVMPLETQRRLRSVYRDVDDIDLFPGGLSERPLAGGLVGSTFACILAQQFSNLRKGDRFWYENGGFESSFTLAQLQQIRHVTLARIICDNLDGVDTLQPFVFLAVDNERNKRVPCNSNYIPQLDLKAWAEYEKDDYGYSSSNAPSHHKPDYHEKPPNYLKPSTAPNKEHSPSYLLEFESSTKPSTDGHKPSYLIDNNYHHRPTEPNDKYQTTKKHPKPQEEHKPTYLIEESFQQTEGPKPVYLIDEVSEKPTTKRPKYTTKRPYGAIKPSITDSSALPIQHKEPNYSNHPSFVRPETKPHKEHLQHKPTGENHQENLFEEYSVHEVYNPDAHEGYDDYSELPIPPYKKPQEDGGYVEEWKPHDENSVSETQNTKPVHTTFIPKPSKPSHGHGNHYHTTQKNTKPSYIYTTSFPLYGPEEIPSTLDYNNYRPQIPKPGYSSNVKASEHYSYVNIFNEPNYYYLDSKEDFNQSFNNILQMLYSTGKVTEPRNPTQTAVFSSVSDSDSEYEIISTTSASLENGETTTMAPVTETLNMDTTFSEDIDDLTQNTEITTQDDTSTVAYTDDTVSTTENTSDGIEEITTVAMDTASTTEKTYEWIFTEENSEDAILEMPLPVGDPASIREFPHPIIVSDKISDNELEALNSWEMLMKR